MFQQRHFEAIAQMLQDLHPNRLHHPNTYGEETDAVRQWKTTRDHLANLFMRHNNRFDLGRFERACEPGANVRKRSA